jgi:hypothetical protein
MKCFADFCVLGQQLLRSKYYQVHICVYTNHHLSDLQQAQQPQASCEYWKRFRLNLWKLMYLSSVGPSPTDGSVCPSPVAGQICGQKGWGYATNNIYSASSLDPITCHQLCLKNADCKSFQVVSNSTDTQLCNLYNTDSNSTNVIVGDASPFLFFDKNCPDYVPVRIFYDKEKDNGFG